MVNKRAEKEYGIHECVSTSELPGNKLRQNYRLGDVTWVKHSGSSWWPAQVIDEAFVGSKPKKKTKHDCLVRLYGTCQYLYVDPWESNTEFDMMLKQENKAAMEVFREVLEKDLSCVNSSSGFDEEDLDSKGCDTEETTEKTSSRKVRKTKQDREVGSTARTGAAVQKGKRERARQSSPEEQDTDEASSENSAEGVRNKRQKQVARREGTRRSGRTNAKESLDAAQLTDTCASEDAAEVSMVDGTSAPHREIKAMVRDILFKDIIDKEHEAEMAYVDEVINGICNSAEDNLTSFGQGFKPSGSRVDDVSSNVTQRNGKGKFDQATSSKKEAAEDTMQATTPSRDSAMKEPGQLSARQIRQIRIMQSLGLIAPSGSPFGKCGVAAPTHR
ncbi:hypothetical protein ACP70R_001043 [Stipagrostis hirtigluma subsp. patula]